MICFDANTIIEIILKRKRVEACRTTIETAQASGEDLAITTLSLDLVMYYAEAKKLNLKEVEKFLRLFVWLPLTEADAQWAFTHFKGKDFEDGLQIACALRERCGEFVTLDRGLYKKYGMRLPVELLR